MKTNPENTQGWTLPAEIPSAFALWPEFRQSLPPEVQEWLSNIEKRIDGLTLDRIEEEADRLAEEDSRADTLYLLGRRLFYARCQQITDIMFSGQGVEFGVNLLWEQALNQLPGAAVTDAVNNSEDHDSGRSIKRAIRAF